MGASDVVAPERAERWYEGSLMVTFAFRCNIACTFCMVEDVLNVYEGTSLDAFKRHVETHGLPSGLRRVIFSGGEVTLAKELVDYAQFARSLPGVEHVRIQTNATRLAHPAVLDALRTAGVDEYFVSLHAADAPTYDALVQREGAFDEIVAGVRAIVASGAAFDSNTAIVDANHRDLPRVVDLASSLGVRSMEFWNYWPRADEDDGRAMSAPVSATRPYLLDALRSCVERRIAPVVKWFPRCLLDDFAWCQDDGQPPALIPDEYWNRRPIYACLYEGICAHAPDPCSGLSEAYVQRHGWEHDVLRPLRTKAAGDPALAARGVASRSLLQPIAAGTVNAGVAEPPIVEFLGKLGLRIGAHLSGFRLVRAERSRHDSGLLLAYARGELEVKLQLHETSAARACFGRSESFAVSYGRVEPGMQHDVQALTAAALDIIRANDPGDLRIPS
jgi:cyclic pyranopterin phosphate synthase